MGLQERRFQMSETSRTSYLSPGARLPYFLSIAFMGYLERIFEGSGPLDFVRDRFIHTHAWLSEQKVNPDEAKSWRI